MTYRLKITVGSETSSVFIEKKDAEHIAGKSVIISAKAGDKLVITKTMAIEVLP